MSKSEEAIVRGILMIQKMTFSCLTQQGLKCDVLWEFVQLEGDILSLVNLLVSLLTSGYRRLYSVEESIEK